MVSGALAPWEGSEGARQRELGVANACSLARNFTSADVEVVIADVLDDETARSYRQLLDTVFIVQLRVTYDAALLRADTRPVWLTWEQFRMLHDQQERFSSADLGLDTTGMTVDQVADAILANWLPDEVNPP